MHSTNHPPKILIAFITYQVIHMHKIVFHIITFQNHLHISSHDQIFSHRIISCFYMMINIQLHYELLTCSKVYVKLSFQVKKRSTNFFHNITRRKIYEERNIKTMLRNKFLIKKRYFSMLKLLFHHSTKILTHLYSENK